MRAAVILTAALVLAGCIGSGAQDPLEGPADSGGQAPEPTASDEPVPPPEATFTFVEDFEMQLQSGAGGANGDNCVIFPDDTTSSSVRSANAARVRCAPISVSSRKASRSARGLTGASSSR